MIGLDSRARIWLCTEPTDMRKSFRGLSALVRNQLKQDPLSGVCDVNYFGCLATIKMAGWVNAGSQSTTITHLFGQSYRGRFDRLLRRKSVTTMLFPSPDPG